MYENIMGFLQCFLYVQVEAPQPASSGRSSRPPRPPDPGKIVLPAGYEPLELLDQVEAVYDFSLKSNKHLPPQHSQQVCPYDQGLIS